MNSQDILAAWCRLLRATPNDVLVLLQRAPYQYKHYQIAKRTGGVRDIYHPTPNLKAVQRWLVANHFGHLPVHESVFSYRTGRGIRDHAAVHLHSNFLLRLDFKDFFPSIDHTWLDRFFTSRIEVGALDIDLQFIPTLVRVTCRFSKVDRTLALSIGAPTSPALSNAILFDADADADADASSRCTQLGCGYTRYADDIYISTREKAVLQVAEREVRAAYASHAPLLQFNERKTLNVSKKTRRIVTGVTLTPDRRLSVGREMKRAVKTQVFLSMTTRLPPEELDHLCGLIAYIRDIEPGFYAALCMKFGAEHLEHLFHSRASGAAS